MSESRGSTNWQKRFCKLVRKGKTTAALRLLKNDFPGTKAVLSLNQEIRGRTIESILQELHPNATKCRLLIRCQNESASLCALADTNVRTNTDDISILGTLIGGKEYVNRYVLACTDEWRQIIEKLSTMAELDAHSMHTVFTHALQSRWIFLARTTECNPSWFSDLRDQIYTELVTRLLDRENGWVEGDESHLRSKTAASLALG
ncbi:hypothetical protein GJ496_000901 [Pomphorhynchus laevis]|nr:hypothetical protein GJ496_000901 [Pomphorhynchus laevis]